MTALVLGRTNINHGHINTGSTLYTGWYCIDDASQQKMMLSVMRLLGDTR